MGNEAITEKQFNFAITDIQKELNEIKIDIREIQKNNKKCNVHDSQIDDLKIDCMNINNNVIPGLRKERNIMIEKVETKIDKVLSNIRSVLISIILAPIVFFILNKGLPVLWENLKKLF